MSAFAPTLIFLLVSYVVGHNFMSIYGMSADTIIHCYCMDDETNDGSPQHAPPLLQDFIIQHKAKMELNEPIAKK